MKYLIRKIINRKNKYKRKNKNVIKMAYLKSKFKHIGYHYQKIFGESYKYNNFNIENYIILVHSYNNSKLQKTSEYSQASKVSKVKVIDDNKNFFERSKD